MSKSTVWKPFIEIKNLHKSYDNQPVLSGINLSLQEGDCIWLKGINGAGKSTLLKILALLEKPSSGELFYNTIPSQEINRTSFYRTLGYLPPVHQLYVELSAYENLKFWGKYYGKNVSDPEHILSLLDYFEIPMNKPLQFLSSGNIQKTSIAKALLHNPSIILLDEPYAFLDTTSCKKLNNLIEMKQEQGAILLLTNHEKNQLAACMNRDLFLIDGKVLFSQ